jgi:kynurenine formamidase
VEDVQAHEERYGELRAGEVVIFQTGHTDAHFGPMLRGRLERTMKAPLDGETEGWPAVTPEVVRYLAGKGVKHIAIDAPSAGSVDPKERAMTYWSAANEGTIFTEYLIDVGQLPATGAFYVFLNPKIENNHGGPGRAIGILPVGTAQASN